MRNECTVSSFLQKQQDFLAFVLGQYVTKGVDQLDADKLTRLLKLRYNALNDAMAELGDAVQVRLAHMSIQRYVNNKSQF